MKKIKILLLSLTLVFVLQASVTALAASDEQGENLVGSGWIVER